MYPIRLVLKKHANYTIFLFYEDGSDIELENTSVPPSSPGKVVILQEN